MTPLLELEELARGVAPIRLHQRSARASRLVRRTADAAVPRRQPGREIGGGVRLYLKRRTDPPAPTRSNTASTALLARRMEIGLVAETAPGSTASPRERAALLDSDAPSTWRGRHAPAASTSSGCVFWGDEGHGRHGRQPHAQEAISRRCATGYQRSDTHLRARLGPRTASVSDAVPISRRSSGTRHGSRSSRPKVACRTRSSPASAEEQLDRAVHAFLEDRGCGFRVEAGGRDRARAHAARFAGGSPGACTAPHVHPAGRRTAT